MRALLVACAFALLAACTASCGSSGGAGSVSGSDKTVPTGSTVAASAPSTANTDESAIADRDKDNDNAPGDDTNNSEALDYGHAASPADRQAVTALVKRYYAGAVAGDGAGACAMLYITLSESVPEDYGHESAGPSYLRQGTTCPAVMGLLFAHHHKQLTAELPLLKVRRVRVNGRHGVAILSFGTMPEREILVDLERHTWKIASLLDGALP